MHRRFTSSWIVLAASLAIAPVVGLPTPGAAQEPPHTLAVAAPLPPGVISWWRAENSAADAVGGNHGTPVNGAGFAPGLVGTAFSFDGINDVVSIPDAPSLRFPTASPYTIEAWLFRRSAASPQHLFGRRAGCGFGVNFYHLAFDANSTALFPLNVWTHYAVTYDGVTFRFFVNGALAFVQSTVVSPYPVSASVLIGGSGTCATFGGLIDELTLYDRALAASEIQGIVAAGSEGKAAAAAPQSTPTLGAAVSGTTVSLSWTAVPGATSYRLRVGGSPGASNLFDANVGNITALTAGASTGTYYLRVHAAVGGIEGGASNEVRIDVGRPGECVLPASPSPLTPSITGTTVRLTWNAVAGAVSYVIEAGSSSGLANLLSLDTGTAVPSFNGVGPPGSYFVRVRAKNTCGVGPPSNEVVVLLGS